MKNLKKYQILNINNLLETNLRIPIYQRAYKWKIKNISDLLNDIEEAITKLEKYDNYKYRIGTIILHNNDNKYDIVDGQQRIISLLLIKTYLDKKANNSLLNTFINTKTTKNNILNNYRYIQEYFSSKDKEYKEKVTKAFSKILEVVVLVVDELSEAFQLFDSQNTRGKELEPHDLLKAYHLRKMHENRKQMELSVKKWENIKPAQIKDLFNNYLFPIYNWSHNKKTREFTVKEIDLYKGIDENWEYPYVKIVKKVMPYFQRYGTFTSGRNFFEMVDYYLELKDFVIEEVYKIIYSFNGNAEKILKYNNHSIGYKYARQLFECAFLCYYDRFENFNIQAIKKIFSWAFMIRIDMEMLNFSTINRYAIGMDDILYSNSLAMFSTIINTRKHTDICNLPINISRNPDEAKNAKWNDLYKLIKDINEVS